MTKGTLKSQIQSSLAGILLPAIAAFLFLLLPLSNEVQGQTQSPSPPVVSISTTESNVEEGRSTPLLFNFMATGTVPVQGIEIELEINETGSFIAEIPDEKFYVQSGETPPLEIKLKREKIDFEPDSTITVRIKDDPDTQNPKYTVDNNNRSASVTVVDNNTPMDGISIISVTRNRPITEGSDALFQVKSKMPVGSNTMVTVRLEDGGGGFLSGTSPQTVPVTITAGNKVGTLMVQTNNMIGYRLPNTITATITSVSVGVANSTHNSDTVIVESDDPVPNVPTASITPARSTYVEGESAVFNVTLANDSQDYVFPQSGGIPVTLITSHSGANFISNSHQYRQTAQFSSLATHTFSVSTARDVSGMDDGMIIVEIAEDPSSPIRYLPAVSPDNSASLTIKHNTPKTVSITSDFEDYGVTEGRSFQFTVTSTPAPEFSDLKVTLTGTGFGTLGAANPSPVIIRVGEPSTTVSITTQEITGLSDTFTVLVGTSPDGRYTPHATDSSISVTVKGNDAQTGAIPRISISPASTYEVIEGNDVQFTVTATPAPTTNKTIRIDVSEMVPFSGSYLANEGIEDFVFDVSLATPNGNSSEMVFSVPTVFESTIESVGTISAEILDGRGYTVASVNNRADRTIKNFTISLSISPNKKRLTEGKTSDSTTVHRPFVFKIVADKAPTSDLDVDINLPPNFHSLGHEISPAPGEIKIPAGKTEVDVTFKAGEVSSNTPLFIEIKSSSDGSYKTSNHQFFALELTILENDSPSGTNPRFSIKPATETDVFAGNSAGFIITSRPISLKEVNLSINIKETGGSTAEVTGLQTVNFPANTEYFTYRIPTEQLVSTNSVDVTVEILDGIGPDPNPNDDINQNGVYTLADGIDSQATVRVTNEAPDLPQITVVAVQGSVNEGAQARFRFTSSESLGSPLDINVRVSETGNFLASKPDTVRLNSGTNTEFSLATNPRNRKFEADSEVTLQILSSSGGGGDQYGKGVPNEATVVVEDINTPTGFSVIAIDKTAKEGEFARFQIKSDTTSTSSRDIDILVAEDVHSSFLANDDKGIKKVTIAANEKTVIHEIFIKSDSLFKANGSVSVSMDSVPNGSTVNSMHGSASITILDDSIPDSGISIVAISDTVDEKDKIASFQVTSASAFDGHKTIKWRVSQQGDFIDTSALKMNYYNMAGDYYSIRLNEGDSTVRLDVNLDDDDIFESDGMVSVEILPDVGEYVLANSNTSDSVVVRDDDLPVLTISARVPRVTEGHELEFEVRADPPPDRNLPVTVNHSITGHSVAVSSVTIQALESSATGRVDTAGVDLDADTTLTLEIAESAKNYKRGRPYTLTVTVVDNESASPSLPRISIEQSSGRIKAGGNTSFNVRASHIPSPSVTVYLRISEELGNFVDSNLNGRIVPKNLSGMNTPFDFSTMDSDLMTKQGTSRVKVTILDGIGYTLAPSPMHEATQEVTDDNPMISVTAVNATVDEGRDAVFIFAADPPLIEDLPVRFEVRDTGRFLTGGPVIASIKTLEHNSQGTFMYSPPTSATIGMSDPHSEITLTIKTGIGYDLGTSSSAKVTVTDDRPVPTGISVIAVTKSVSENETATFQIRSDATDTMDRTISISVSDGHNGSEADGGFLSAMDRSLTTVRIPANRKFVNLDMRLPNDSVYEPDGEISVEIRPGSYTLARGNTVAKVTVSDDDAPAGISIIAKVESVTEGSDAYAIFQVTSSTNVNVDTIINLAVDDGTGDVLDTDFLGESGSPAYPYNSITIMNGKRTAELKVKIKDDNEDELEATVTAMVKPPDMAEYVQSGFSTFASVRVVDNDTPVVSIARINDRVTNPTDRITEGYSIGIEVTVTPSPVTVLRIPLSDGSLGSLADFSPGVIVIPRGQSTDTPVTGMLTTKDVSTDTTMTVSLVDSADGSYDVSTSSGSFDAKVVNNDSRSDTLPIISISPPADSLIAAGTDESDDDSKFTITASSVPSPPITVYLLVSESGNFISAANEGVQSHRISDANSKYLVATTDDTMSVEGDSIVTVTLLDSDGYALADFSNQSPMHTASVRYTDVPPTTPDITLSTSSGTVNEGEMVSFQLTLTPPPRADITVNFKVTETGNFLADGAGGKGKKSEMIQMDSTSTTSSTYMLNFGTKSVDTSFQPDSTVTLEILSAEGYVLRGVKTASVTVLDANTPTTGISVVAVRSSVMEKEGASAIFQLRAATAPSGSKRTVNVTVEEVNGDFVLPGNEGPRHIDILDGKKSAIFEVPIFNDRDFEPNGQVKVTINSGSMPNDANKTAVVDVFDDDTPGESSGDHISVVAVTSEVNEGEDAIFQIRSKSDTENSSSREININVSHQGQNFIDATQMDYDTIDIMAGKETATLEVKTVSDGLDTANGMIVVQIEDKKMNSTHDYTPVPNHSTASVVVLDDDVPQLTISPAVVRVTEGYSFEFRVTANPVPHNPLTVHIDHDVASGEKREIAINPSILSVPVDGTPAMATVATAGNMVQDGNSSLTFTIRESSDDSYGRTSQHTLTATVLDNDTASRTMPRISINRLSPERVQTGTNVWFELIASHMPQDDLQVNLHANDPDNFINTMNLSPEIFENTGVRQKFTVVTVDPDMSTDNTDAMVTLSLRDGENYSIADKDSSGSSASVTVSDDDPEISVSAVNGTVDEGDIVVFEFTADPVPSMRLPIIISVEETAGDFLMDKPEGITSAILEPAPETRFELKTKDADFQFGSDSVVTLTIESGSGYRMAATMSASVTVLDSSTPTGISIVALNASVTEDDSKTAMAMFQIKADDVSSMDRNINISIDDGYEGISPGGFLSERDRGSRTETIPRNHRYVNFFVSIASDNTPEPDGEISVTVEPATPLGVNPSASYTVAAGMAGKASIKVEDDDTPVGFSVYAVNSTVNEGENAEFQFASDMVNDANPRSISITVSEVGTFIDRTKLSTLPTSYLLDAGKMSRILTIPTLNDRVHEPDGSITVAISETENESTKVTATVNVMSEDAKPEISIRSVESAVEEGFPARFEVLALDRVSSKKLDITVEITEKGGFLLGVEGKRTVVLPAGMSRPPILLIENTRSNVIMEADGEIAAQIVSDTDYNPDPDITASKSTVLVLDNDNDTADLPVIEISNSNVGKSIEEGWDALFMLTATPKPASSIRVKIRIEDSGDFLLDSNNGTLDREITIGSNGEAKVELNTVADSVEEDDGKITVGILSDPNTMDTYSVGIHNRVEINVIDNDDSSLPSFIISRSIDIDEGEEKGASFVLIASSANCRGINVTIEVSQVGNFLLSAPGHRQVSIDSGCHKQYYEPLRTANSLNESDGKIIAKIVSDPAPEDTYAVGSTFTAEVTVKDANGPPFLSFDAGQQATEESGIIIFPAKENSGIMTFTVRKLHESVNDVKVSFAFDNGTAEKGKDFEILTQSPLVIPNGMLSAPIEVRLTDDNVYEWEEDFTITLLNPQNARFMGRNFVARGLILDDEVETRPVVEFSAPEAVKESDGRFRVTVSITPAPQGTESISVSTLTAKDKEGNYFGGIAFNSSSDSIEIGGNSGGTGSVDILLRENKAYEGWGTITVTLASTVHYTVPNEARKTSMDVRIADAEEARVKVSLTAEPPVVSEGKKIAFTVRASPPPSGGQTLRIPVTIEEIGTLKAYLDKASTMVVVLSETRTEQTLSFQINRNNRYKGNVRIAIKIAREDGYEVGSTGTPETKSVEVEVTENDEYLPEISIAAVSEIEEGNTADFTISAYPVPSTDLSVRISSMQNGNFSVWSIPNEVILPKDTNSIVLSVPTRDVYEVDFGNGSISVTIEESAGAKYHVSLTNRSSTVAIINNSNDPATRYSIVVTVIKSILLGGQNTGEGRQSPKESSPILPEVRIATVQSVVEEGQPLVFIVSSDIEPEKKLLVRIGLVQTGSFISGALSRTVALEQGQLEVELRLQTNDDEYAGEDGTVAATVLSGEGYSVGEQSSALVVVSDESDRAKRRQFLNAGSQAVLPDLFANLGARTLQASDHRFKQNFIGDKTNSFKFSGQSDIKSMLEKGGKDLNNGSINLRSLLGDSSFSFDLFPEDGSTGSATVWGLGDLRDLPGNSETGSRSWGGDAFTGHFGVETSLEPGYLTGLAVSVSESDMHYGVTGGDRLRFDAATTGLHPYLGFQSPSGEENLQIVAGYGRTEVEIHQEHYSPEIVGGEFVNIGFKGSHRLYSSKSLLGRGATSLEVAGQGWMVRQFLGDSRGFVAGSRMDARHYRLFLKGGHELQTDRGFSVTPTLSAGIRGDGSHSRSYRSLELGNGLNIEHSGGLSVSGEGGMHLADGGRLRHWEVQGRLAYDHGQDGLGLLLETEPVLGWTADGNGQVIWKESLLDAGYGTEQTANGASLDSEIGYGFDIWSQSGILTLTGALKLDTVGKSKFRFGNRIEIDPNFVLQLENTRTHDADGSGNNKFELTGRISW